MADGINFIYKKSFTIFCSGRHYTIGHFVIIFNISFSFEHLFRLTVRSCHAIANALTLAAS
jgi:hypothetical protein